MRIYEWFKKIPTIRCSYSRHSGLIRGLALCRASGAGGFTLLEMVVSLGIFSVVIVTAIGAMLSVQGAQVKAANIQTIQDNLRFALESMTKEMRAGTAFRPFAGGGQQFDGLTFTRSDGSDVGYCFSAGALRKISGSSSDCSVSSAVTSEDIVVEDVTFYVIGQAPGRSDGQPRITIALQARSQDVRLATSFRVQTTVTSRVRDF